MIPMFRTVARVALLLPAIFRASQLVADADYQR
jgi:hypothetical protein